MNSLSQERLRAIILGCKRNDRGSQKRLYTEYYNYAMGVCLRYAQTREEAQEILQDGFLKVFAKMAVYKEHLSFKTWFRSILVHTAIDHYRRNHKHIHKLDISYASEAKVDPECIHRLNEQHLLYLVWQLPRSYQMAFNLFVIEGYSHDEIAQRLEISVGTSKSNLAKARMKLRKMITSLEQESYELYG